MPSRYIYIYIFIVMIQCLFGINVFGSFWFNYNWVDNKLGKYEFVSGKLRCQGFKWVVVLLKPAISYSKESENNVGSLAFLQHSVIFFMFYAKFRECYCLACIALKVWVRGFEVDAEAEEDCEEDPRDASRGYKTTPSRSKVPIKVQIRM